MVNFSWNSDKIKWKKRMLADVEGYEDWWNSVHLLRCAVEDYLDGSRLSYTSLLDRALHIVARGLWLLQRGQQSQLQKPAL